MFKNRYLIVLGVLSLLLVGMAVSNPFSNASPATDQAASDFYQRHADWMWTINEANAVIPVTGGSAYPDYAHRHPELSAPMEVPVDTTDYYFRHPEVPAAAEVSVDTTDYFFRHPELLASARSIDLTDYYFRHPELSGK